MNDKTPAKQESLLANVGDLFMECGKLLVIARRTLRMSPSNLHPDDQKIWCRTLERGGVKPEEVLPALEEYMVENTYFPAPAQIVTTVKAMRKVELDRRRREREHLRYLEEQAELEIERNKTPEQRQREREEALASVREIRQKMRGLFEMDTDRSNGVVQAGAFFGKINDTEE